MRFAVPLLALFLAACSSAGPSHYERAVAIERELLRTTPEITYSDSGYVQVLRELKQVPSSSPDRTRALGWAQRISDGRRIELAKTMPQVAHLPRRLAGHDAPLPPRPGARRASPRRQPAALTAAAKRLDLTDAQRDKLDITLYSTTWCGYCKKARAWMTSAHIPFEDKDIEKDPEAHAAYQRMGRGYRGVPLIVVNGKALRGFSRPSLEAAIRAAVGS